MAKRNTGTVSPSRLTGVLNCPRQARLNEATRGGSPGAPALIGLLVHRVFEHAPQGMVVKVDTLLDLLAQWQGRSKPEHIEAARAIIETRAPLDMTHAQDAEVRFGFSKTRDDSVGVGKYRARGIVDRVDRWANGKCDVVDYKSGAVKTLIELKHAPQTVIYLAWAASEFGTNDLTMVYDYVSADIQIRIPYNAPDVRRGLIAAEALYDDYLADDDPQPVVQGSCSWCDHMKGCSAVEEATKGVAYPGPWEGLDMPQLVEMRQQVAGDAKMLEGARKAIDGTILDMLRADDVKSWAPDGSPFSVKITSRAQKKVDHAALLPIAASLGKPLIDVVREACTVSAPKLKKLVRADLRAQEVLALNTTASQSAAFLKVTTKGGLL